MFSAYFKVMWSNVKVKMLVFVQMLSAQNLLIHCMRFVKLDTVLAPRLDVSYRFSGHVIKG